MASACRPPGSCGLQRDRQVELVAGGDRAEHACAVWDRRRRADPGQCGRCRCGARAAGDQSAADASATTRRPDCHPTAATACAAPDPCCAPFDDSDDCAICPAARPPRPDVAAIILIVRWCVRQAARARQQRPRLGERRRPLERVLQRLVAAEALDVPGVELAQVAGGALGPEVLAGPVDHPVELGQDLLAAGLAGARRRAAARTATGCPASRGPAARRRRRCARTPRATCSGLRRPPEIRTGTGQLLDQRAARARSRARPVWRWEAWRGWMQSPATPPSSTRRRASVDAAAVAGTDARAQLDRDRQPAAARRRPRQRDRPVGIGQQRRPGAGLAHLGHRAAHVDVDQVGAGGGHPLGGRRHHLGVVAEQLHRHRVLVGVDPQQLAAGALVAVVHGEARDHLGDDQAGAVALGLQAHEPVADPGQRGQHDAVGDRDPAERPGVGQPARGHRAAVRREPARCRSGSPSTRFMVRISATWTWPPSSARGSS